MQESASVIDTVKAIRQRSQPERNSPKLLKSRKTSRTAISDSVRASLEDKEPEKLTYSMKLFCAEYVKNKGNGTQAALKAYNCSTENAAAVLASGLLKRGKIQSEIANIDAATRSSSITPELITSEIAKIAISDKANTTARIKALELLGRIKAMFIDRVEQRQVVIDKSIDLSNLSTAQLLATLQARLRLSSSGIRETVKAENSLGAGDPGTPIDAQYSVESAPSKKQSGEIEAPIAINTALDPDGLGGGGMPTGPGVGE